LLNCLKVPVSRGDRNFSVFTTALTGVSDQFMLIILTIFAAELKQTMNMNQSNESFQRDIDELIRLIKKMKAKAGDDRFDHLDPMLKQQIDFMINNYETVKHSMSIEMINKMGLPIQQMLRQFIEMVKRDLGEDYASADDQTEEPQLSPSEEKPAENRDDAINRIDKLLQKPNLTEEQINHLLDKRNQILGS
jgi:hypothetical protein